MATQTSPAPVHGLALSEGRGDRWFSSQVLTWFLGSEKPGGCQKKGVAGSK